MSTSSQKVAKVPKNTQETQESIIKQLNEAELILVGSRYATSSSTDTDPVNYAHQLTSLSY